jgi:hypothetical protein
LFVTAILNVQLTAMEVKPLINMTRMADTLSVSEAVIKESVLLG